jgi:hypothetical protein
MVATVCTVVTVYHGNNRVIPVATVEDFFTIVLDGGSDRHTDSRLISERGK